MSASSEPRATHLKARLRRHSKSRTADGQMLATQSPFPGKWDFHARDSRAKITPEIPFAL
jgi:hypothetical protein